MNNIKDLNKVISILLCFALLVTTFPVQVVAAENPKVLDSEYIYLDLYYGDISITGTSYTGYVLESGEVTQKTGTIDRKVYIYQSNGASTTWKNGLPVYDRVASPVSGETWGEYITNNINVTNVITNWSTQASKVNRSGTGYRINITGACDHDITLDNIWSNYHQNSSSRVSGGLAFYPGTDTSSKVTVNFKGDNRFGNIFYGTNSYTNHQMIISGESDATLTVANISSSTNYNHYNSAIGGSDNSGGDSVGLVFNSGVIFAGTTYGDNCTAIGAGGNAKGGITINGGTITAVSNSTGVALGGGIGYSSAGGDADIEINGGTIYAYNFGFEGIPAAAIGGGSSRNSNGNTSTTVTIGGGTIYAESVGGTAIGGGSSKLKNGGSATINIGGDADVTARSTAGTYNGTTINAGAAIGGGTGGSNAGMNGGNATVNIYGQANVYTGSIGGGKTNNSTGLIGNATVVISDNPTIQGQFIMAAGSSTPCSFTMNGGTIDNSEKTDAFIFLQENGGAVYVENGNATMSGGIITGCSTATNGGAIYVAGGDFTMTSGAITHNTASNEGGAIYVNEGDIIIGLESCLGNDETHSHPIISNNTSTNNGGGISINGGEITMYCGNFVSNNSISNQSSNNVNQSSGVFNINGGTLGIGILVTGGTFDDSREGTYQVRFHAIYDDVSESVIRYVESNQDFILPKEDELQNENFSRDGVYLIGWSTSATTTEGYMFIGDKVSIPQNTDLYAVWGDEEPITSYVIYIPETLEIGSDGTGEMSIEASLKYFTNIAKVNVTISDIDELTLDDEESVSIGYGLYDENDDFLIDEDVAATFSRADSSDKYVTTEIVDKALYSGNYTDTLLFTVEYFDGL